MNRQLETELMEEPAHVIAYAEADFSSPNQHFMQRLIQLVDPINFHGTALDLGCGPGEISFRFANTYPNSQIYAVDGSKPMLDYARRVIPVNLTPRVQFILGYIPQLELPHADYDLIFSNSLLHHLPNPHSLWQTIKRYAHSGTTIAVMDLLRPTSIDEAQNIVHTYASTEPELLQRDFYASLLAAFSLQEITEQLQQAKLNFDIQQLTDRHVFITGIIP